MRGIIAWMPDEAYPVLGVLIAIGLIIGLLSRQRAFGLVGLIVLFALLGPFISALFNGLPSPIALILIIIVLFSLARAGLNLVFGRRATDHFVGEFMFAMFSMPFRMLAHIFRPRRRIW